MMIITTTINNPMQISPKEVISKRFSRNQYLILRLDEERAIAAIPKLLPDDRKSSEAALALIHRVIESGQMK